MMPNQSEGPDSEPTERLEVPPTLIQKGVPATGRDLKLAIITGLTLAALVIGLLYIDSKAFFGLAFIVILFAQGELYVSAQRAGHSPATTLGLVGGAVMLLGVFLRGPEAAGLVLFLSLVFTFVWYLASESQAAVVTNISVTMLGIMYVAMLGSFAGLLAARPNDGRGVTITMIGTAAVYDIFAYAAGSRWGKTPIAKTISPKKTVEGAAVATVGIIILSTLVAPLLGPWNPWQAALLGAMVAISAPLGDLFESMIKRDLKIKDMGSIFPGHGGALDRIDAILFTAPVVYLSLRMFGL